MCLRCVGNLGWLETALRGQETDLVLPFLSEKSPFWLTLLNCVAAGWWPLTQLSCQCLSKGWHLGGTRWHLHNGRITLSPPTHCRLPLLLSTPPALYMANNHLTLDSSYTHCSLLFTAGNTGTSDESKRQGGGNTAAKCGQDAIAISQLADTGLRHPHHPGGNGGGWWWPTC